MGLIRKVSQLVQGIATYVLVAMMLLTMVDVIGRYVFNRPVMASFEITYLAMVIVIFLSSAFAQACKRHISVTILYERLPERVQAVLDGLSSILGIGVFSLISWQAVLQADVIRLRGLVSQTLLLPIWPFLLVVAFGSALLALVFLADLRDSLARMSRNGWGLWLGLGAGLVLVLLIAVASVWGGQLQWEVSPINAGFIGIVILFVFMFLGMPVALAMGLSGFFGMIYISGIDSGISLMRTVPFTASADYTLSVIPLFIMMGMFASYSGLTKDLYDTGYKWLGRLPGGLAMATTVGCAGFGAVCGDTMAATATVYTVSRPEMKRLGFSDKLAVGVIAAGGTISIMIPPSIALIIYAMLTEQSIGKLFMAGIIPGITEALFYIITIYLLCRFNPSMGPRGPSVSLKDKLASLTGTWQTLLLFLLVMGGIYMGIFSATEAGGIGAFGAFLFGLIKWRFTRQNFRESITEAATMTSMLLLMVIGMVMFSYFMAATRLPYELGNMISQLGLSRYVVMGFIVLIYLIMGCFMSAMGAVILTAPIFYPVIVALGFDPIWFGIILVRLVEIGSITPPYGLSLFVMKGIAKDVSMGTIYRGLVPFIIADIVHVALLIAFPQLSLFLPGLMD